MAVVVPQIVNNRRILLRMQRWFIIPRTIQTSRIISHRCRRTISSFITCRLRDTVHRHRSHIMNRVNRRSFINAITARDPICTLRHWTHVLPIIVGWRCDRDGQLDTAASSRNSRSINILARMSLEPGFLQMPRCIWLGRRTGGLLGLSYRQLRRRALPIGITADRAGRWTGIITVQVDDSRSVVNCGNLPTWSGCVNSWWRTTLSTSMIRMGHRTGTLGISGTVRVSSRQSRLFWGF